MPQNCGGVSRLLQRLLLGPGRKNARRGARAGCRCGCEAPLGRQDVGFEHLNSRYRSVMIYDKVEEANGDGDQCRPGGQEEQKEKQGRGSTGQVVVV